MTGYSDDVPNDASRRSFDRTGPTFLIYLHIATCCLSLIYVAKLYAELQIVMLDVTRIYTAALNIVLFAPVSIFFAFCRFSSGYFLGFYFYTMILGYLWLVEFSKFQYDHTLAAVSAFVSALAFLVPVLFITSPIRQWLMLSARAFNTLLSSILILTAAVIAIGALYNFRVVWVTDIYNFRDDLEFPAWLGYALGATSNSLLPFAFACFVMRGSRWRAVAALLLLLLVYPITLAKVALFAPLWLLFLVLLSRRIEARTTVVLSLLLPISAGVILVSLFFANALTYEQIKDYFNIVNYRMIVIPSIALDVYNHFFSTHDHTYFCQLSFLKRLVGCPYADPLSIVMSKAYGLGNFNASLFATEGVASVGLILAPIAVFGCGLVISIGNRLSSGLPPRFILISGALLPQILLNVPLTTSLLTNGAALLFLLWYVTPRGMFEQNTSKVTARIPYPTNWSWTKKLVALKGVVLIWLAIAWGMKSLYVPVPAGYFERPFQTLISSKDIDIWNPKGIGVWVAAPELEQFSDSSDQPTRSPFVIYEGDKPLGPAHSLHADIEKLGNGRFSHWTGIGFIFSSSDGTDPRTNGRVYRPVRMSADPELQK